MSWAKPLDPHYPTLEGCRTPAPTPAVPEQRWPCKLWLLRAIILDAQGLDHPVTWRREGQGCTRGETQLMWSCPGQGWHLQ